MQKTIPSERPFDWQNPPVWLSLLLLVGLIALAYGNSLQGAPLLDDNRLLPEYARMSFPPSLAEIRQSSLAGRPLAAFTFAANTALFGLSLPAFHAVNIAIHMLAALAFFGVVRRTALLPGLGPELNRKALGLALFASALWALHPLQTQAVTYITQRCESLMGLFYFSGLYCWIRGFQARYRYLWQFLSLVCLVAGFLVKETIFTLPLVIVLSDLSFYRADVKGRIKSRGPAYGIFILFTIFGGVHLHERILGALADPDLLSPLAYATNQPKIIFHYLLLFLYPVRLCFDYAWPISTFLESWPYIFMLSLVVGLAVYGLLKRSVYGLLGCLFFILLFPTSSFIPIQDLLVEHRMYLPSAALSLMLCIGGAAWARKGLFGPDHGAGKRLRLLFLLLVLGLAGLTFLRNEDYRLGPLHMWQDVLAKRPENRRANAMVGSMFLASGKWGEGIPLLSRAITGPGPIPPASYALAASDYSRAIHQVGKDQEAFRVFMQAASENRKDAVAIENAGMILVRAGQFQMALDILPAAVSLHPKSIPLHFSLAQALAAVQRYQEAIGHMQSALDLYDALSSPGLVVLPGKYELYLHLGDYFLAAGDRNQARAAYMKGLSHGPSTAGQTHILEQLRTMP